jgi:hypothetical protein
MLTCNVIVLQHFEQHRALASALSLGGVSFGSIHRRKRYRRAS